MSRRFLKGKMPTPAMIVALVALVMSMTGGAYALGSGSAPKSATATTLAAGTSESGTFSGGGGTSDGGWFGMAVQYRIPLAHAIANNHIVDTHAHPNKAHCPGPGKAARGYLCLYFNEYSDLGSAVYGYSTDYPYDKTKTSVGVGLYAPIAGPEAYADGVWTVTAR